MPLINMSGSTGSDTIAEPRIDPLIARDSEVTAAVNAHVAAADPHTTYLNQVRGDARYRLASATIPESAIDPLIARDSEVAAAVNAHVGAVDPHTQYLNQARGDARYRQSAETLIQSPKIIAADELSISAPGYRPLQLINTLKNNNPTNCYSYAFYNMKGGENGGMSYNTFALYSYADDGNGGKLINVPFVIQDNLAVRLGAFGPFLSGNSCAIGNNLQSSSTHNNIVGIGNGAEVTGQNQIQLGGSNSTVYAYGAIQNRSDLRDKTDIRPTILGLSFIKSLRPVDFRWDLRDSYRKSAPTPIDPESSEEEKALYDEKAKQWQKENKLSNLAQDGSKKGKRYHHGLIAQELQELIRATGIDFGGFQDHKIAGGEDVLSVGYAEFIAPLIKAVQELADRIEQLERQ